MTKEMRGISLTWKIALTYVSLIMLTGLFIVSIVYKLVGRTLRQQSHELATVIATNLSDTAAGFVIGKNLLQLDALVTKYARLPGVAYAFIEDREGRIIAKNFGPLSPDVGDVLTADQRRRVGQRQRTLQGNTVYETWAPILEGQLGTAHLGGWADAVEQDIYQAIFLIVWPITVALIAAVIVAVVSARRLVRPFWRLTEIVSRISTGDLATPISAASLDEFGELTRSLERMRSSLNAAMVRLDHT